jgi:hypothetical protein
MELTIEQYIATSNPKAAKEFVVKYGLPPAKSWSDLLKKMQFILKKNKDTAFSDLASIDTPYKHLITDIVSAEKEKEFADKFLVKEKELWDKLQNEVNKKNEVIQKVVEKEEKKPKHLIDIGEFADYFKMSNADGGTDTKKEVVITPTTAPHKNYTGAIIASVALLSVAAIVTAIIVKK